jgi:hypothetical protein
VAHVKAALHQPSVYLKADRRRAEELLKRVGEDTRLLDECFEMGVALTGEHYDALKRAKEFFGVDDDHHAALAMAMVLFPPLPAPGRPKGTKTWTFGKYLLLAEACSELWEKDNTLSDTEICKRLGRGGDPKSDFKYYDPDHLRTLLPKARRAALGYLDDPANEEAVARRKGEL